MKLSTRNFVRDGLYAARLVQRYRAFSAAMVLTVAIVVGASVCIFIPLYVIAFRGSTFPAADRLVLLWESNRDAGLERVPVMEGAYAVYRRSLRSFQDLAAFIPHNPLLPAITVAGTDERVIEANATPELYRLLGAHALIGRTFEPSENDSDGPQAVVPSYRWWRRHFAADRNVVGRTLALNYFGSKENYTIVGVMPPGFEFPHPLYPERPDLWLSLPYDHHRFSPGNNFYVIGKLKAGVPLSQCQAELRTAAQRLALDQPRFYGSESIEAVPLRMELVHNAGAILVALISALGFVLLIGCANIANLVLARATWRERETHIRMAIGATRFDILRLLSAEVAVLAILGGVLGLLLATWGAGVLPVVLPASLYIPRAESLVLEWPILLFTFALCVLMALGMGLVASANVARKPTALALRGVFPGLTPGSLFRRPGGGLLIVQVALAVALVCGAGVTLRSLRFLLEDEGRVTPERLLAMDIFFSNDAPESAEAVRAEYRSLLLDAPSIQGIKDVALVDGFPLQHYPQPLAVTSGGATSRASAEVHVVTPNYFPQMGLQLISGRPLEVSDSGGAQAAAIVNETFARRYFPLGGAIGVSLRLERQPSKEWPPEFRVVGIVREPLRFGSGEIASPSVYIPFTQAPMRNLAVLVRTTTEPRKVAQLVRKRVLEMAPGKVTVNSARTGQEIVADSSARDRFISAQLAAFAALALILASAGIYGLISFYTSRRTHEVAVRIALGSTRVQVVTLVLRQGMALVGAGVGLGLTLAPLLVRLLVHTRYYARPLELPVYGGVAVLFCAIGLVASYLPARRAALTETAAVMREQ